MKGALRAGGRVAVTGIGVVSAIGIGVEAFLRSLLQARCGLTPLSGFDLAPFRGRFGGEVRDFDPAAFPAIPGLSALDRHAQMAVVAAREALADAALCPGSDGMPARRMGLVFATCNGGMLSIERHYRMLYGLEEGRFDEALDLSKRYFGAAVLLARVLGLRGPVTTVVTACAASSNAIGLASDWLRDGVCDAVLVGGADAFSRTTFAGFDRLKTTSSSRCAPFSEPMGLTLGEGAGFWVMELEGRASSRGARIRGYVLGYGLSNDAYHPTSPDQTGQGVRLCMERALEDAGVDLATIGYINAHGTGTEANDRTESRAIARLFGEAAAPPVSSTKSFFGHALGAAGILEASAALLSLGAGMLPPTLNFTTARDACTLDYVPNVPRPTTTTRFLSNNFAFGGNNCSLVLALPGDPTPAEAVPRCQPAGPLAITGIGVVSALGVGIEALLQGLAAGTRGIAPVDRYPVDGCSCRVAGLVRAFDDPSRVDRRLPLRGMDRASQYATVATKLAMQQAALPLRPKECAEVGLILGLTYSPTHGEERYLGSICTHGLEVPDLGHFPYLVLNSVAGNVARALLLKGFSSTLCGGHGAGLESLAYAALALRLGHTTTVLAGASDELTARVHGDLDALGRLATTPPGEGAVVMVLETCEAARARGGRPLARVAAASGCFVGGLWGEDREGALTAFLGALLATAGVAPGAVGTLLLSPETPDDGVAVAAAARNVLGDRTPESGLEAVLGWAPATAPLLALAAAVGGGRLARGALVTVAASRYGEVRGAVLTPWE